MYSNSERNYFDYATDSTTQMQKLVSDCRDWKNQCTDLSSKDIIKKYIEKIYNADKHTTTDDYSKGLEYVMGLVRDILATVIENDNKINNTTIELLFKEFQPINTDSFKSDKLDELKKFCKNVIDTKRIKRNHEIISKRYNFKDLLRKEFLIGDRRDRHYHTPFIFSICRKLDTYNLELPEKINLMCEELAYLLDHEYRYAYIVDRDESRNEDSRWETLKDIVPGVMTYILGTYSAEGIPEDVFNKVISAAASKVTNSSFFNANRIENSNVSYFNAIMNSDDNEYFFSRLAKVQRNGDINTKRGLLNFIFSIDNFFDLDKLYYYVIYFYAIFTPTFERFNLSLRKILNALVTDTIEKSKTDSIESQLYKVETAFKVTSNFLKNLKPTNRYIEGEAEDFKERYQKVCDDLENVCKDINEKVFYFKSKKKVEEESVKKESVDVNDDTGLPLTISDYEKKILSSSEFMISRLNESVEDKQNFIDIITDKAIISHKEATDFLSKAIDECPEYFNLKKLKSYLQESYNVISEDQSIETTSDRYIAMGEISNIISKIDKYYRNTKTSSDIIDESFDFADYDMSNINNTVKQILETNISNYIISETVHNVVKIPVHEMKISSYGRLVLDKFRQGYDYLNDKQKAVFDTLDRLADRFSHFDDKEARAEARMQVIKGQMLPPLSKCLKTILFAGLIAIINPWLGLLAIIVKYVTSKNATKEERQAVCDELEVEIQMIDRKIQDAVDEKDYKLERKLRLLKKKMLVQYSKISFDNMVKWDNSLYMKSQTDETGQKIGLKED